MSPQPRSGGFRSRTRDVTPPTQSTRPPRKAGSPQSTTSPQSSVADRAKGSGQSTGAQSSTGLEHSRGAEGFKGSERFKGSEPSTGSRGLKGTQRAKGTENSKSDQNSTTVRTSKNTAGRRKRGSATEDAAREAALEVVRAVREDDAYGNLALSLALKERRLSGRDAAFATEITYGTLRTLGLLDAIIAEASQRPVSDIDGELLDILRLGSYQLLFTHVAPHAAVSTSVDLSRQTLGHGPSGFINAVLRTVGRRNTDDWIDTVVRLDNERHGIDAIASLALRQAHPRWIAQAFADALGVSRSDLSLSEPSIPVSSSSNPETLSPGDSVTSFPGDSVTSFRAGFATSSAVRDELQRALAANNVRPIVHLTARPGVLRPAELATTSGGSVGRYSPFCVYMDNGGDPGKLGEVRRHDAWVQDEGSQLIVEALVNAPLIDDDSGKWLDLCAGPGGKAALLGSLARERAIPGTSVTAIEPHPHRADLVRQAAVDLPVDVIVADGRSLGISEKFDRILVDAPCSGLGALRRRPESRWRHQSADIGQLSKLQSELLESAAQLVRPGGVIVYSTCSPHLAETSSVVESIASRHNLEILDTPSLVPQVDQLGSSPFVQLWPHRHGTDAMFFSALRRPRES